MKSSLKLFFSLFLAAGSFTAFAASYTDGIEYFKAVTRSGKNFA